MFLFVKVVVLHLTIAKWKCESFSLTIPVILDPHNYI